MVGDSLERTRQFPRDSRVSGRFCGCHLALPAGVPAVPVTTACPLQRPGTPPTILTLADVRPLRPAKRPSIRWRTFTDSRPRNSRRFNSKPRVQLPVLPPFAYAQVPNSLEHGTRRNARPRGSTFQWLPACRVALSPNPSDTSSTGPKPCCHIFSSSDDLPSKPFRSLSNGAIF
jgi:hypothetical protein